MLIVTHVPSVKVLDMYMYSYIVCCICSSLIHTTPYWQCSVILKMATGYMGGGMVAPLINLGWNSPAGQMYSTVNDLFKVKQ